MGLQQMVKLLNTAHRHLEDRVGLGLITAWCWFRFSYLLFELALKVLPEMKQWLNSVTGLRRYFRTAFSALKINVFMKRRDFPAYIVVSFA
jgi:hypothetical protein